MPKVKQQALHGKAGGSRQGRCSGNGAPQPCPSPSPSHGLSLCPGGFPREPVLRPGRCQSDQLLTLLSPALPSERAAVVLRPRSSWGGGLKDPEGSAPPPTHQGPAEQESVPGHLRCCAGQFQLRIRSGLHFPCHSCPGALLGSKPESDQNPGILVRGKSHALS